MDSSSSPCPKSPRGRGQTFLRWLLVLLSFLALQFPQALSNWIRLIEILGPFLEDVREDQPALPDSPPQEFPNTDR